VSTRARARILLALAGTGLLLAGCGWWLFSSGRVEEWTRRLVEDRLAEVLGRPVRVHSLEMSPTTGEFDLRGIESLLPGESAPLVSVERVRGRLVLSALLRRRLVFERLDVENPLLSLERVGGKWSWTPGARRGQGRFDARRIEIRGGRVRIEDRDTPFEAIGENLQLEFSGRGETLEGRLTAGSLLVAHPRTGPSRLAVAASFVLRPGRLTMPEFRVTGDWLELSGRGEIELSPAGETTPGVLLRSEVTAAVDVGAALGFSGPTPLSGRLRYAGKILAGPDGWKVQGTVDSETLSWKEWRVGRLKGPIQGGSEGLLFGPAAGTLASGRLEGQVRFAPRDGSGRAEFTLANASLAEVLAALDRPLPLAASVAARGEIVWPKGGPGEARGTMEATLLPASAGKNAWPVEGKLAIGVEPGTLTVAHAEARSGGASLSATGRIEPAEETATILFTVSSEDLARSAPLVASCARTFGAHPEAWQLETIDGRGVLSGTALLHRHEVTAAGSFAAPQLKWRGVAWGEAAGLYTLDSTTLRIEATQAHRDRASLLLDATFPRRGEGLAVSGEVSNWPATEILGVAGLDLPVEGDLSGDFSVEREKAALTARARATMGPGKVSGFAVDGGEVELSVRDGLVRLLPLSLRSDGGSLMLNGTLAPHAGHGEALVSWKGIDLARLTGGAPPDRGASGATEGDGSLTSGGGNWRFDGRASSPQVIAAGIPLGAVSGTIGSDFRAVTLSLDVPALRARAEGTVSLEAPNAVEAQVLLRNTEVQALFNAAQLNPPGDIAGQVSATLAVSGPLKDPARLRVEGTIDSLQVFAGPTKFALERQAIVAVEEGRIVLHDAVVVGEGTRLTLAGSIDPADPSRTDLRADGEVDLSLLGALLPDTVLRGAMDVHLRSTGPLMQPALTGTLTIAGGRLRRFDSPVGVDDLQAFVQVSGNEVKVSSLQAVVGGGTVSGNGSVTLKGLAPESVQATLRGTEITVSAPEGFRGTYGGTVRVSGSGGRYLIEGDLDIARGLWRRDFRLESFALASRIREFKPSAESSDIASRVGLKLNLRADDDLWMKNDLGTVETKADMKLGGTLARPELTGRIIALEGGQVRFRRVDYRVEEAAVEFNDPSRLNPWITVLAETRVSEYDVTMHIYGTLDRLDYQLTSNPALSSDQIVSLLVTGSPTPVGATGQAPGELARAYLGGSVTGIVEQPVEHALGLSTFRIDPMQFGAPTDAKARVTAGKRVGPDLQVFYSQDVGGASGQIYGLEYAITRHLRAYAERGALGGLGADLRFRTRFTLGRVPPPPRPDEPGGPRAHPVPKPVTKIVFEGQGPDEEPDLRRRVGVRVGENFTRRRMFQGASRIKRWYLEKSWLEARVHPERIETPGGIELRYRIDRGRRIQVRMEGAGREERALRKRLDDLWQEALFTEDLLDEAEREIAAFYRDRGNYTVLVDRAVEDRAGKALIVTFRIDPGEPVRVGSVRITGNAAVGEERIRRQMLTVPDTRLTRRLLRPNMLDEDLAAIRQLYREKGFLSAQVESALTVSPEGTVAMVEIRIREGDLFRVRSILFEQADTNMPREELQPLVPLREGDPYGPGPVAEGESSLRRMLDRKGYADARVTASSREADGSVEVVYEIAAGPGMTVGAVQIEGNHRTREELIRRELKLSPGDPVSHEQLRAAQQRLYRLGVFEGASLEVLPPAGPEAGGRPGSRIILVRLKESPNLMAGVAAGYDSENGPRGSIELENNNLGGRARTLGFQALASGRNDRVQALLKDPRLLRGEWDSLLTTFWEREERDTFNFTRYGSSFQISRRHTPRLTSLYRYTFSLDDVYNLANVDLTELRTQTGQKLEPGRTRLASAGGAVIYDTRDSPFTPTRGISLSADARVFLHPLGSEETFGRLLVQGTWLKSLSGKVVFASSARVGVSPPFGATTTVPLQERFFAGGDNTVRGFPPDLLGSNVDPDNDGTVENPGGTLVRIGKDIDNDGTAGSFSSPRPFGGEALLIFNEELRFPIRGALGGVVFYDAGNTFNRVSDLDLTGMRHTAGLGLRLETPVGPVRLEYGRKLDRQPGEGRGQFYLSIGPAF